MPYSPPSGWVETRPQDDDYEAPLYVRFHARPDCPRIGDPSDLRRVDKPYSATRCMLCASELDQATPYTSLAASRRLASA
jgi:hypothetical protein